MSLFRQIPPTAGLPIYAKDWFLAFLNRGRSGSLEEDFKNYLGVTYASVTNSGTAAFYIILESLKSLSLKKNVIIPSFICPLIPLAIQRAGLKVLVCDINQDDFNFQINQLVEMCSNNNDILAIVAVHLAGIPLDFQAIQKITRENKIFIIEDCAQSLGAQYQGKKTGSFGDFAFYSLCRGKGLTIYEGGVITSKAEFAPAIESVIKRVVKTAPLAELLKILELFGYWIFYRPLLFWFVFRLPQIFWQMQGKMEKAFIEYFEVTFPVHKVSGIRKKIGHVMFNRIEREIAKQRQIASTYITELKDLPGIKLITGLKHSKPNYPYLTLVFDDELKRRRAFNSLMNSGLGISQIYLSAITDYDYLRNTVGAQDCPNARLIAKHHITLTTSTFLTQKEALSVIEEIKKQVRLN
ncbi:MAG: DegT/DnrJ/EryC1/StrS aminotransferase family protein [Candidatus Omnitrophota bacterium]|nr:DegT/DnrJ/EryC1/StrS aminotransferase family protein [Candidatus Omnitrophota bacterium]